MAVRRLTRLAMVAVLLTALCSACMLTAQAAARAVRLEVLNPTGLIEIKATPAPRTGDLAGKTVCLQWNGGWRGDVMFPYVQDQLIKRFPGVKVVPYTDFTVEHPNKIGEAAFVKAIKAKGCNAAVLGNAG